MSQKSRMQLKCRQRLKRRATRQKLEKAGKNPDDFFIGRFYMGNK